MKRSLPLLLLIGSACQGTQGAVLLDKDGGGTASPDSTVRADAEAQDAIPAGDAGSVPDGGSPPDDDGGTCPPCIPPPSPDCVGSGPCGCGPYTCPSDVSCGEVPPVFPELDRTCSNADDCVALERQFNCCGTRIVTGVNVSQQAAFEAAAALCESQFPGCGCAQFPTAADDGTTMDPVLMAGAEVECRSNICTSTFPQSPQTCGSSTCDPATEVCVSHQPIGPSIQYRCEPIPTACAGNRTCDCLASTYCISPFDRCVDVARNEISCNCLQCQ